MAQTVRNGPREQRKGHDAPKHLRLTKMSEARMYKPSVARRDMTMLRNMEFVKSELAVRGPSFLTILSIPLKARKKAAI